jgi:hypothetical protein
LLGGEKFGIFGRRFGLLAFQPLSSFLEAIGNAEAEDRILVEEP